MLVQTGATASTLDLAAPLSQVLHDGSASYVYGNGAERLRAAGGDWYIPDAPGSVRATLDGSGNVLATTSYDPWGLPQAGAIAPFGFTGEVQDTAGMVYLRARWYDAGSGRFGVRDPFAGFPEVPYSLNPYQYGYAAPTVYTDPTGEVVYLFGGGFDRTPDVGSSIQELRDYLRRSELQQFIEEESYMESGTNHFSIIQPAMGLFKYGSERTTIPSGRIEGSFKWRPIGELFPNPIYQKIRHEIRRVYGL